MFAGYYQVRRAFHHIHANILGESGPARRLRAAVWQSIFTRDGRRYRRALYARMGDVATLVTGPSGTGKELVARAIGLARYIPFDDEDGGVRRAGGRRVLPAEPLGPLPHPHRVGALRPPARRLHGGARGPEGLVRGVPARSARSSSTRSARSTPAIQVKLLRVLQTRTFQRLGDTADRAFSGKLIAATNRDLRQALAAGRFREDFYYRLCADLLVTPSLAERLRDTPGELRTLLRAIARRVAGDEEADDVAAEAEAWIAAAPRAGLRLARQRAGARAVRPEPRDPRDVRAPGARVPRARGRRSWTAVEAGALSADALLRHYCTWVYAQTGSYSETARRLGLDPRTARDRVDPAWLAALQGSTGEPEGAASWPPRRTARLGRAPTDNGVTDGWPR